MTIDLVFITYNRLHYTKLALTSILADKMEEFSLTIWDNSSTDGTGEYLKNEVNDPRIKDIVFSKVNVGQIAAVNTVWSKSKADLLGKLDNDCLVTPGWTKTLAQAHEDIDNLGVVACWHYFEDDFDYQRAKHKIQSYGRHQILRHPWTCGTGILLKRSTFEEFGPIKHRATTKYWQQMAMKGYVNGFYYPLILQEHMDDPKSEHSRLKDEESYQQAKSVTFGINSAGQETLEDRWHWRQKVLSNLLDDPWQADYYQRWRRKIRSLKAGSISLLHKMRSVNSTCQGSSNIKPKKKVFDGLAVPNSKIVALNRYRLARFQTKTVITKEMDRKIVCKYPITAEAESFIKTIADREKKNVDYLKDRFDVLCGTLENSHIKYDYLQHPSLASRMQSYMQLGDSQRAHILLDRYIEKLRSLQTVETIPVEFFKSLVNQVNSTSKVTCLSRGLLDLTPKNILINGSKWIVIDSEWSFGFAIPLIFIVFRGIMELAVELQREIRSCANKDNPVVSLFGTTFQTYYIPLRWNEYIKESQIDVKRLLSWELGFTRYVAGANIESVGRTNTHPSIRYHFLCPRAVNYSNAIKKNKLVRKGLRPLSLALNALRQKTNSRIIS